MTPPTSFMLARLDRRSSRLAARVGRASLGNGLNDYSGNDLRI